MVDFQAAKHGINHCKTIFWYIDSMQQATGSFDRKFGSCALNWRSATNHTGSESEGDMWDIPDDSGIEKKKMNSLPFKGDISSKNV